MKLKTAIAAAILLATPSYTYADDNVSGYDLSPGRCLIKFNGKTYVDGPCDYADQTPTYDPNWRDNMKNRPDLDETVRYLHIETDDCTVDINKVEHHMPPPGKPPTYWAAWWNGCRSDVSPEGYGGEADRVEPKDDNCWGNDRVLYCVWPLAS